MDSTKETSNHIFTVITVFVCGCLSRNVKAGRLCIANKRYPLINPLIHCHNSFMSNAYFKKKITLDLNANSKQFIFGKEQLIPSVSAIQNCDFHIVASIQHGREVIVNHTIHNHDLIK